MFASFFGFFDTFAHYEVDPSGKLVDLGRIEGSEGDASFGENMDVPLEVESVTLAGREKCRAAVQGT